MYKLIRDKIPELMAEKNKHCYHAVVEDPVLLHELIFKKIHEETEEARTAKDKNDLMTELADIYSLLEFIAKEYNFELEEIKNISAVKTSINGGFDKKYVGFFEEFPDE